MVNKINLKEIERKAYRESMRDGFTEIFIGIILLYASLIFHVSSVYMALFIIFGPKLLETLKERYTYPRIGYVKPKAEDGGKITRGIFGYMLIVVAVMAVVLGAVYRGSWSSDLFYKWMPTFVGAMLLGAMLYTQGKSGDNKYYVYGILALVAGIAFSLYDFEPVKMGLTAYLQLSGGAILIVGIVTFIQFNRRHPIPKVGYNESKGPEDLANLVGRE